MADTENLGKLIRHLDPAHFEAFMMDYFGLPLFQMIPGKTSRIVRESYLEQIAALSFDERQEMEQLAERILLLTDDPGQDAIKCMMLECLDFEQRRGLEKQANQYERSLWLYTHAPSYFEKALNIRLADLCRQSRTWCSGYVGPKDLAISMDETIRHEFHQAISNLLQCTPDQVVIDVFERYQYRQESRLFTDNAETSSSKKVMRFQINIHYNLSPQSIEWVKNTRLDTYQATKAASSFVTYDPENGQLEVMSKNKGIRHDMANLVAQYLMQADGNCEPVTIRQYNYQFLSKAQSLSTFNESIAWAKVTHIGVSKNNESFLFKINHGYQGDIYSAAQSLMGSSFSFEELNLSYIQISIRPLQEARGRSRTIQIQLRGENLCNIKSKKQKDRQLADRLLNKWGITQAINEVDADAANQLVA